MLGEKIVTLRKKEGLSQEQLSEKIGVTRQTISNWELNETSPNPEQLKLLSKVFNISIDELLDNDIKNALVENVSNTERLANILAGIAIKILKIIKILLMALLVIFIIAFIIYLLEKDNSTYSWSIFYCQIEEQKYGIKIDSNNTLECYNCTEDMKNDLGKIEVDFNEQGESIDRITEYFKSHNGTC